MGNNTSHENYKYWGGGNKKYWRPNNEEKGWWGGGLVKVIIIIAILIVIIIVAKIFIGGKTSKRVEGIIEGEFPQLQTKTRTESEGERECKRVLKVLYGKDFERVRPAWLRWKNGYNLEIDCFSEENPRLALEFNGVQHYKFTPAFHKTKDDFEKQKARDKWKIAMCKEREIPLIIVPYYIEQKDIQSYIIKELVRLKLLNKEKKKK